MVDRSGFGLGTCVILNSGSMSHGLIGGENTGLSKGLVMSLVVLINPLTDDKPLDFSLPWYACDVSNLNHLQLEILSILNSSVEKYFWVSSGLGWLFGLGHLTYHITYFQALEKANGAETLAASWPTRLTHMSGERSHLQLEMLIGWDNLSHAIQKLLNVNNIDGRPKLMYTEYHAESESEYDSQVQYVDRSLNPLPPVRVQPMFHQAVLLELTSAEEEARK